MDIEDQFALDWLYVDQAFRSFAIWYMQTSSAYKKWQEMVDRLATQRVGSEHTTERHMGEFVGQGHVAIKWL